MDNQTPTSASPISIKLTESAVFLRSQAVPGNDPQLSQTETPAILRGLLVLNFEKPVKVSEIVVKLTCKCFATRQEGAGPRRIDVTEQDTAFKAKQVFFTASHNDRRRASLPPAIVPRRHVGDLFPDIHAPVPSFAPITAGSRPRQPRRLSADLTNVQQAVLEQSETRYPPPSTPCADVNRAGLHGSLIELRSGQRNSGATLGTPIVPSREATPPRGRLLERIIVENIPGHTIGPPATRRSISTSFMRSSREAPPTHQSLLSFADPQQSSPDRERTQRSSAGFSLGALSHSILDKMHPFYHRHSDDSSQLRDHSPDRGRSRTRVRADRIKQQDSTGVLVVETIERYISKGSKTEMWKEFKPGVHTYAISIPIPADQPPSVECPYGKVSWTLKATVHRPGTFTPKYQHSVNIAVVHNRTNEDEGEMNSVTGERAEEMWSQWDQQHFYIGGTLSFSLTLFPLDKVKIHKLTVFIEERIDYLTKMQPIVPTDTQSHIILLSAKSNDGKPILPIESDHSEAFRMSPLHQFLDEDDDISTMTSNLMGPGPWTLRKNLELPSSCSLLHWTHLNRKSLILISHVLKCIIRVERGDDHEMDKKTGKRKLYDLVIHTPIYIGSCYCNPNWAGLPPYSTTSQDTRTLGGKCPCEIFGKRHGFTGHFLSRPSSDSDTTAAETSGGVSTMLSLRGSDAFYQNNVQYERLVSGQEGESGEAPPPYPSA
ncbi:hypothetical protein DL96DRAFT_1560208 [Flagelloscypha sp. PMI_526]|nr:hypothetical protein DL96DRAFT_1560208 [Flagelloscypha sp. PMI_526]